MTVTTLTPDDLDAIADRIADRLRDDRFTRLLDTEEVAARLKVRPDWVREHAAELGGMRVGDNERGHLRFDWRGVAAAMDRRQLTQAAPAARRSGGRPAGAPGVDLLPIPEDAA